MHGILKYSFCSLWGRKRCYYFQLNKSWIFESNSSKWSRVGTSRIYVASITRDTRVQPVVNFHDRGFLSSWCIFIHEFKARVRLSGDCFDVTHCMATGFEVFWRKCSKWLINICKYVVVLKISFADDFSAFILLPWFIVYSQSINGF